MTIFWDSYRLVTAQKLFWITLGLSIVVAMIYASIGFNNDGVSILFGAFSWENDYVNKQSPLATYLYLTLFADYFVPIWLGVLSLVLALISTCSIFPSFLNSGSIDVAVSKPIGRVSLFIAKYLSSLLFVAAQVFCFCVIVFFAFGLRMDSWNFGIFWAVPLIVFVFSLIFSVAVLTSIWTKSTLLSLLIAMLVWGGSWGVQIAESWLYKWAYVVPAQGLEVDFDKGKTEQTQEPKGPNEDAARYHRMVVLCETPLPKTRDITYLLKKKIKINGHDLTQTSRFIGGDGDTYQQAVIDADEKYQNRHSELYTIGTSLAFEFCILGLACWMFVRKDF